MKKLAALLLVAVMACCMLTTTAFADGSYYVESPEYNTSTEEPAPTSPQTGYEVGIAGVAAAALLCGAVAVGSAKKARA